MKVLITRNERGDFTAEINLANEFSSITGGSVYAYGDTEDRAKANLFFTVQEFTEKLLDFIHGED